MARPKLIDHHFCLRCYGYRLTRSNCKGIERTRQKRAWRRWEME